MRLDGHTRSAAHKDPKLNFSVWDSRSVPGCIHTRVSCASLMAKFVLVASAAVTPAVAADSAFELPKILDVQLGFVGKYKVGYWTPVNVKVRSGQRGWKGRVELTAPDGDGLSARFIGTQNFVDMLPQQEMTIAAIAKFGRIQSSLGVMLIGSDDRIVERLFTPNELPEARPATHQFVVHVGKTMGIEEIVRTLDRSDIMVRELNETAGLPIHWAAYDGVDTLIMTTGQLELYSSLMSNQVDAIERWVKMGGQLILSVGHNGNELLGQEGLLQPFLPGEFDGVVDQCQTVGLENFADVPHQIEMPRKADGRCQLIMTLLHQPAGKIELIERGGSRRSPVVVRTPHGLGQVVFVAVDLDRDPIAEWKGRERFIARLLEWTLSKRPRNESPATVGPMRHSGYSDLTGQLRGALDQYREVSFVPFWLVAVLVTGYLVLIGPVDYLLVRHVLRRVQWTWLTFSFMVVGACILAYSLTTKLKGENLYVNQVDIADVDTTTGFVRGTTWAHTYSPATRTYDLSLSPSIACGGDAWRDHEVLLSWQGLPGTALGGMNTTSTAERMSDAYVIDTRGDSSMKSAGIWGIPIQIWSSKGFHARWHGELDLPAISKLQVQSDGRLRGEIGSPLACDLTDCFLYYTPWAYNIGKVSAGQTVTVGSASERSSLQWRLTRRTYSDRGDMTTPWDQYSRNVPRIIEMMMFHDLAGGEAYTGLSNHYQTYVDLSSHLSIGRAILVGRTHSAVATLRSGNESLEDHYDQQWTFYRFILPVMRSSETLKSTRN